jgi:hypothetical protein
MGTYENFYLNQIKQLQEENKKLKQIIDEGIVGADVRGLEHLMEYYFPSRVKKQRDKKNQYASDFEDVAQPNPGRIKFDIDPEMVERYRKKYLEDRPAPVVPGRIDPKVAETLDRQIGDRQIGFGPRRKKEKPYASDDMESRRTQPGYGPSSDSPAPGPSGRLTPLSDNMVKRLFPNG